MASCNYIFAYILGSLIAKYKAHCFPLSAKALFSHHHNIRIRINCIYDDNNNNGIHPDIQHKYHHHITDQPSEKPNSQPSLITNRRQWIHGSLATAGAIASTTSCPTSTIAAQSQKQLWNDPSCDPTISVLRNPVNDQMVYILGTTHISEESAQLAGELVRYVRPEGVFIELDAKRVGPIVNNNTSKIISGPKVEEDSLTYNSQSWPKSSTKGAVSLRPNSSASPQSFTQLSSPTSYQSKIMAAGQDAVQKSIRDLYKRLEAQGFSGAGSELVTPIEEGLKLNSTIILGDRDIDITFQRLTEAFVKKDLLSLISIDSKESDDRLFSLIPPSTQNEIDKSGTVSSQQLNVKEVDMFVESMKTKDNVKKLTQNLKDETPELYQALVAERDFYMANGINQLGGAESGPESFPKIVAVMGIAHLDGVERNLRSFGWIDVDKPTLCK